MIRLSSRPLRMALAIVGCFVLGNCMKTATVPAPSNVTQPLVASNKNEPVIFNDQRFLVSFDYRKDTEAYDVVVRRAGKSLRQSDRDLRDAEQVAQSTLTHYACPGSTKARRLDGRSGTLNGTGEWRSQLRCG